MKKQTAEEGNQRDELFGIHSFLCTVLHSGYAEQPQNCLPVFLPFFAIRKTICCPQFGQIFSVFTSQP